HRAMRRVFAFPLVVLVALAVPLDAQQPEPYRPDSLTAAEYRRAEQLLSPHVDPLVRGGAVQPTWLPDDRFWYRNTIAGGVEFVLVDPTRRTRERAFDHERLASAISAATGSTYTALQLPFTSFTFEQ